MATTIDTIYDDLEIIGDTTYYYRISSFDFAGNESQHSIEVSAMFTSINDSREELPKTFSLFQNYPNPFNPVTEIKYAIPRSCYVKLEIWNIRGQKVATLVDEQQKARYKVINFDSGSFLAELIFTD